MTDEKKPSEPMAPGGNVGSSTPKITRRRFTKAGALGPVVMALSGRPVWGQTCTPSAVGSLTVTSPNPEFRLDSCVFACSRSDWASKSPSGTLVDLGFAYPSGPCGGSNDDCTNKKRQITQLFAATLTQILNKSVTYDKKSGSSSSIVHLETALEDAAAEAVAAALNLKYSDRLNSELPNGSSYYPFYSPPDFSIASDPVFANANFKDAFVEAIEAFWSPPFPQDKLSSYYTIAERANATPANSCPFA